MDSLEQRQVRLPVFYFAGHLQNKIILDKNALYFEKKIRGSEMRNGPKCVLAKLWVVPVPVPEQGMDSGSHKSKY